MWTGKYSQWTSEDLKKELLDLRRQINDPESREIEIDYARRKVRQIMAVLRSRGL